MDILVAYDVRTDTKAGRRRLRKVGLACLAYGQRVQKSVFECSLSPSQYVQFEHRLLGCINQQEDQLRIYRLPVPRGQYVTIYGRRDEIDLDEPLVL